MSDAKTCVICGESLAKYALDRPHGEEACGAYCAGRLRERRAIDAQPLSQEAWDVAVLAWTRTQAEVTMNSTMAAFVGSPWGASTPTHFAVSTALARLPKDEFEDRSAATYRLYVRRAAPMPSAEARHTCPWKSPGFFPDCPGCVAAFSAGEPKHGSQMRVDAAPPEAEHRWACHHTPRCLTSEAHDSLNYVRAQRAMAARCRCGFVFKACATPANLTCGDCEAEAARIATANATATREDLMDRFGVTEEQVLDYVRSCGERATDGPSVVAQTCPGCDVPAVESDGFWTCPHCSYRERVAPAPSSSPACNGVLVHLEYSYCPKHD